MPVLPAPGQMHQLLLCILAEPSQTKMAEKSALPRVMAEAAAREEHSLPGKSTLVGSALASPAPAVMVPAPS